MPATPTMTAIPALTDLVASPHYTAARRRVVRQLVESLCHEGLLPVVWRKRRGEELAGTVDASGGPYTLHARRRAGFGRLTLSAPPRRGQREPGPAEMLHDLAGLLPADPDRLDCFAEELERTTVNDALARWHGAGEADTHPYHPSFKSRVGFDLADNLAFGPEFHPVVTPRWLAVDRELVTVTPGDHVHRAHFLAAELDHEFPHSPEGSPPGHRLADGSAVVPVHPWQWDHRLAYRLAPLLASGSVTDLGPGGVAYRPRASIRTLANADHPDRCDLKLALGITNTSTERTLASHTVANAAPISDWLHSITATDPALRGLIVLREILGVSADCLDGHLAAIWRESLRRRLEAGETATPFTQLATPVGPTDPAVCARIARDGARAWLQQLLQVTLVPLVHLLVAHGIAVEAHAQNLLLVHEDGWPVRLAIQDLHDGIRFTRRPPAAPAAIPALRPTPATHVAANRNSYIEADAAHDVRDFLLDALLFVNLGQLALALDEQNLVPEARFWQMAREAIQAHRDRHGRALAERHRIFDVLAPGIMAEQLTARRLLPESERRVHSVGNPLAPEEEG